MPVQIYFFKNKLDEKIQRIKRKRQKDKDKEKNKEKKKIKNKKEALKKETKRQRAPHGYAHVTRPYLAGF